MTGHTKKVTAKRAAELLDTWTTAAPPPAVVRSHMALADPVPVIGDHLLLSHLGRHGIEAFLSVLGEGSGSPLLKQNCGAWVARRPPTLPAATP
ncbi:hypothetical protein [Streptomyces lydicus]|uniref:hypothetical protein n=1 Tax=Streptomyces lydicus TaxID=47763 RepID=UPI0036E04B4F